MGFNFLKIESFRRGIIFSSFFNLIAKGLVFIQGLVIAYYFGAQTATDVYFYCFSTVTLAALFINSLDSSVIIPEGMRLAESEGREAAMKFFNFFIYLYIAIGVVAAGVFYISPVRIILLISQFDAAKLEEARTILLLSIPLFCLIITTNLVANILASYKYFTMPMMVNAINGISALGFLVLLHENFGIASLLVGTLASYFLNLCFLLYVMNRQLSWTFAFQRVRLSTATKWNILMAQAGNITSSFANYFPMYLMSSFGAGVLTSFTYGQKTSEIPNQAINLQFTAVAGIKFNLLNAKKDLSGLDSVFLRSCQTLLAIQMPIALFMSVYHTEIIDLFFRHGAFDKGTAEASAVFLKYFAFLLPFYSMNQLTARLFMATQKIKEAFWYQITINVFLVSGYYIMVGRMGPVGLPIALVTVHAFSFVFCFFLFRWFFPFIHYNKVLKVFATLCVMISLPAALTFYLRGYFAIENPFISLVAGGTLFAGIIAIIYYSTGTLRDILKKD